MDAIKAISQDSLKAEVPQFSIGDTIRVDVNIREGDRERIHQIEGTGLGLAIVKHIARIHNARIKLDSVVDAGTTITVIFETAS